MQAIETKYLPPTDHKGARIKAIAAAGSVTIGYYSVDSDPHKAAAMLLCKRYGWEGSIAGGQLTNGNYAWVMSTPEPIVWPADD